MQKQKHKLIFLGTPEFAVPFLNTLLKSTYFDIIAVITTPDKPTGRGRKIQASPIKQFALKNNLKILQPTKIENCKLEIESLQPDVAVVIAYGKIIPKDFIDIFPYGIINIHPSLLPKYRGPNPLRAPILAGEDKTGISIMKIDEKMDHGPILNQTKINITKNDNIENLYEKVVAIGPDFLLKTLKLYLENKIKPKEQNHKMATFTKMITKEDAKIDWSKSVNDIDRQIHAYSPIPGAHTILNNKILKILQSCLKNDKLVIEKVKLEGKQETDWKDFLNGYRDEIPEKIKNKIKFD